MSSDRLLPDPIDEEAKRVILSAFFQINSDSVSLHAYDSYFQYYDREINRLLLGLPVPFCAISGLAAKSHSDIAVICQVLAKDITIPRRVALERLRSIFPRDDHLSMAYAQRQRQRPALNDSVQNIYSMGRELLVEFHDHVTVLSFIRARPRTTPLERRLHCCVHG